MKYLPLILFLTLSVFANAQKKSKKAYQNLKIQVGEQVFPVVSGKPIPLENHPAAELDYEDLCGADPAAFGFEEFTTYIYDNGEGEYVGYEVVAQAHVKNVGTETFDPRNLNYIATVESEVPVFRSGNQNTKTLVIAREKLPMLRPGESLFFPRMIVASGEVKRNATVIMPFVTLKIEKLKLSRLEADCNLSNNITSIF